MYHNAGMRTTLTLDSDIYEVAMHLSRATGRRLGKIISELARKGLQPPQAIKRRRGSRFAVFEVPSNAPLIPASRIQETIDEEGFF
jgi:hypothetical protein